MVNWDVRAQTSGRKILPSGQIPYRSCNCYRSVVQAKFGGRRDSPKGVRERKNEMRMTYKAENRHNVDTKYGDASMLSRK